jgi:hypothetical protein
MQNCRRAFASLAFALLITRCGIAAGQELPMGPTHNMGASVTGAFEGWFPNPDGSFSMLVGYFNRNLKQAVDIPIGPNNHIDPGGPDQGQPTHLLSGRGWGMFTIKVPKDFGSKKLIWSLTVNGATTSVPINLLPLYRIAPFIDAADDTPAYVGFSEDGPFVNGPIGQSESIAATVGTPVPLTIWVADDNKAPALPTTPPAGGFVIPDFATFFGPVSTHWTLFRGPGEVRIDAPIAKTQKLTELKSAPAGTVFYGKVTNSATFSEPGQYILNIQAFDSTGMGGGGFQCCWTNAEVNVTVKPAASN